MVFQELFASLVNVGDKIQEHHGRAHSGHAARAPHGDGSARSALSGAANIYLTLKSLFTGRVSPKELHGPFGIFTAAVQIVQNGVSHLLLFLGFLSINLAVLNFLPIPVLDGGHMVFLIWEGVTRRRPSEKVVIGANYAGMAFLLSLMLFVLYLDIFVHPFK